MNRAFLKSFSVSLLLLLVAAFFLPSSAALIDTSPYTDIQTQIGQKEAEIADANANQQFGRVLRLQEDLSILKAELDTPRMVYLESYVELQDFISRTKDLFSEISSDFAGSALPTNLGSQLSQVDALVAQSERSYGSGDYDIAYEVIQDARSKIASAYSSSVVIAKERISRVEDALATTSYLSPGRTAMLDEAKNLLDESRGLFERCRELWLSSDSRANEVCRESYIKVTEALDLINRAEENPDPLEDLLRWALLIIPLVLVVGLFLFFSKKLGNVAINVELSRYEVSAMKKVEVRRTITVANLEKTPITATVRDTLPKALKPSTTYVEPQEQKANTSTWVIELAPEEKKEIAYTFLVPELAAGWPIKIRPAEMTYRLGRSIKIFSSEETVMKVI